MNPCRRACESADSPQRTAFRAFTSAATNPRFMERPLFLTDLTSHEPGRDALLVGPDAQQRVPTRFMEGDQPRMRRPSSRKMPLKFISSACGLVALARASFSETLPSLTSWKSAWLKLIMPSSLPVSMAAGSLSRRFSSISFLTVGVLIGFRAPASCCRRRWSPCAGRSPPEACRRAGGGSAPAPPP